MTLKEKLEELCRENNYKGPISLFIRHFNKPTLYAECSGFKWAYPLRSDYYKQVGASFVVEYDGQEIRKQKREDPEL